MYNGKRYSLNHALAADAGCRASGNRLRRRGE
jgi:hypothetical protein